MNEPNNSEDHRRECEAREVMKWSHDRRIAHYTAILAKRGPAAMDELIAEVKRQYRLSQAQRMEI